MDLYYEDYEPGQVFRSAGITLTESEIIDFALRYDPQPFHIDLDAAARSHFGGLIASGWQVVALSFRAIVDAGLLRGGAMGSPGLEALSWLKPVRPGDTIRTRAEVTAKRDSKRRDDRGYVTVSFEVFNQRDELVMTYSCPEIIAKRPEIPATGVEA